VRLSRRQMKAGRVAQGVACRMDFGSQSTLATPDGLKRSVPPLAPALG
jgi:hypothetical protein